MQRGNCVDATTVSGAQDFSHFARQLERGAGDVRRGSCAEKMPPRRTDSVLSHLEKISVGMALRSPELPSFREE